MPELYTFEIFQKPPCRTEHRTIALPGEYRGHGQFREQRPEGQPFRVKEIYRPLNGQCPRGPVFYQHGHVGDDIIRGEDVKLSEFVTEPICDFFLE